MTLAVEKKHIMQAVDWSRFDLEGWLYQFGAWQNSVKGTCGRPVNPIATAMDAAVVKRKKFKLGVRKKRQIIADVMSRDDVEFMPKKKQTPKDIVCEITDNEARSVQRLVLDLYGQSDVMDDWLDAVVDRYFYFNSWSEMVIKIGQINNPTIIRSKYGAEQDVKCGLAVLHSRYKFIEYK